MTPAPIALTCGEPAGIGPELAVKAWQELRGDPPFFFIGDPGHLPNRAPVAMITEPTETARASGSGLPVLPHPFPTPARAGQPDPANAQAVLDTIARGVELVVDGAARALCTAPVDKKALRDGAGFAFPGHTEYLAALCGAERAVMLMSGPQLRTIPATVHMSLAEVPRALTPELLEQTLRIARSGLIRDFGLPDPRIAVAGMNPHAGEDGVMGIEDDEVIRPLVSALRQEGWRITGPHPADTMFHTAARAHYDAAVCMYHDQALIPIKTLDFDHGVNVTLGLPIIRTSPDHGTAYDIAGTGRANPSSLVEALRLASRMARTRAA